MKIKRFLAKDMRTALAQVKETLGSDAVIMSNKKVAGGIEIVAAVDYDSPVSKGAIAATAQTPSTKTKTESSSPSFLELAQEKVTLGRKRTIKTGKKVNPAPAADSLQALLERQQSRLQQPTIEQKNVADEFDMPAWAKGLDQSYQQSPVTQPQVKTRKSNKVSQAEADDLAELREEIVAMRNLLTHQVSELVRDKRGRDNPVGAMLESRLIEAEFSPQVAKKLSELSEHYPPVELVKTLPRSLANMLDNQGDDIVKQGGVVAFVGPTGVGKTTSVAKLAARYAAKHGSDQVALITTDHYRIGAFEQLATYGKIMGCPVKQAHDLNELEQVLYQFRNRKLVLIDTAGMGQRDLRLFKQLDNLTANAKLPIRSYLVLSATAQRGVLADAVEQFSRISLSGVVLTKLDETVSLAPALSVLIQNGLPLSYVTDGQRVPEDIQVADTLALANQALSVFDKKQQYRSHNTEGANPAAYAFE